MTDNEFILFDRLEKIRSIVNQYGESEFSISFSGGKDSVVLSNLIDEALPGNKIPRVYINTGIEYKAMVEFVEDLQKHDDRIVIIQPKVPIKPMLEKEGYPFKSKAHSFLVGMWQSGNRSPYVTHYYERTNKSQNWKCPQKLQYQFEQDLSFKISPLCCDKLKKEPLKDYTKSHKQHWQITGLMSSEGGQRNRSVCTVFAKSANGINKFQPLSVLTKEWEDWYISERKIQLCKLYYPPFNFERTGCKGCPFNINLQEALDVLAEFFPAERKQCEWIWKPVYDEYRRLNYRLIPIDDEQMSLFEEVDNG